MRRGPQLTQSRAYYHGNPPRGSGTIFAGYLLKELFNFLFSNLCVLCSLAQSLTPFLVQFAVSSYSLFHPSVGCTASTQISFFLRSWFERQLRGNSRCLLFHCRTLPSGTSGSLEHTQLLVKPLQIICSLPPWDRDWSCNPTVWISYMDNNSHQTDKVSCQKGGIYDEHHPHYVGFYLICA